MKITVLLLLLLLSMVKAEIEFHLLWQAPASLTSMYVSDLNTDGYKEILLGTGSSYEKVMNTSSGSVTALICEGLVSQFESDGTLVWEKKLCLNDAAQDPCYANACISTIYADTICTTTSTLIFTACCYCGMSSIIRVYTPEGELLYELYDDDGAGNPVPIQGCVRIILADDIDADNCKELIAATNLEILVYDTDCITCTIPQLPTYRTRDLPAANRPTGIIYEVITVNFDDDPLPTKEIVVAADQLSVYEHNLTLKWQYEIDTARPVKDVYAYDLDSDTSSHEIDQDPDLEPELIVGESWYCYVLDNIEYGNTDPTDDDPDLKWEYSTSPYEVNTVFAGRFAGPRNVMAGSALMVHVLDYNGALIQTFNAVNEVRKFDISDFEKDGKTELVIFSNRYVSVFSPTGLVWNSEDFQGSFIGGTVADISLDGFPEIVAGYTLGLYVIGVEELKTVVGSEADKLYDEGAALMEKGDYIKAVILFEQARAKYEKAGNNFMAIQCQKRILECEKFMDTDRIVAVAMEELRNYEYDQAGYLFGEAANLYSRMGDRGKMSQMRVLKEASEKLWQSYSTLMEAHNLFLDEKWNEARTEAVWAGNSFKDVSTIFLTMSMDSLYETLKLEVSARTRECEELILLCDEFVEAETDMKDADQYARDADRFFRNQQYSEARYSHEKAQDSYTKAAQLLDELQFSLGERADSFRRDIYDIDAKIKTLEESDLYQSYEDVQTQEIIKALEEKKAVYEGLIDEYGDLAESVGRKARDCRTRATLASSQASQSYSMEDKFMEYMREALQPPTSLAVGLAFLIVALIGLSIGKGRYVALAFLVVVLIFLGLSVAKFWSFV